MLLIYEQSRTMAELSRIVRNTARFRAAELEGTLTRLPTGDGMALVFFGDPETHRRQDCPLTLRHRIERLLLPGC